MANIVEAMVAAPLMLVGSMITAPMQVIVMFISSVMNAVNAFMLLYGLAVGAVIVALLLMRAARRKKAGMAADSAQAPAATVKTIGMADTMDHERALTQHPADTLNIGKTLTISGQKITVWLGKNGEAEKIVAEGDATIQPR